MVQLSGKKLLKIEIPKGPRGSNLTIFEVSQYRKPILHTGKVWKDEL